MALLGQASAPGRRGGWWVHKARVGRAGKAEALGGGLARSPAARLPCAGACSALSESGRPQAGLMATPAAAPRPATAESVGFAVHACLRRIDSALAKLEAEGGAEAAATRRARALAGQATPLPAPQRAAAPASAASASAAGDARPTSPGSALRDVHLHFHTPAAEGAQAQAQAQARALPTPPGPPGAAAAARLEHPPAGAAMTPAAFYTPAAILPTERQLQGRALEAGPTPLHAGTATPTPSGTASAAAVVTPATGDSTHSSHSSESVDALLHKLRVRIEAAEARASPVVGATMAPASVAATSPGAASGASSPHTPASMHMGVFATPAAAPLSSGFVSAPASTYQTPRSFRELTADRVLMSAAAKALDEPDALTRAVDAFRQRQTPQAVNKQVAHRAALSRWEKVSGLAHSPEKKTPGSAGKRVTWRSP